MPTYDHSTLMKDAGAIAADAAAQVGGSNKILDLGSTVRLRGEVVIQVTAIDVSSGDERYILNLQGSTSSSFASAVVNLASFQFGDSSVTLESVDSVVGRYEMPFVTEQNGVQYRYLRMYTDVNGTTPSIDYTARIVKEY